MVMLSVSALSKKSKDKNILHEISFTQALNEKIAIAGETGSGKTTLLKMIAGLDQPDAGEIQFNGIRVKGAFEQLIPGHPQIAYLSQHFELRNNYWVREILAYANELPWEDAERLYSICRIGHLLNRRTDELSGGERQRIALARLLSASPRLLLLDEPFSNLDALHKKIIKEVIEDIGSQLNISLILVSHEPADILSWADKILIIQNGVIIQQGNPVELYHQPRSGYAAGLLGDYNLLNVDNTTKMRFVRPEYFQIVAPNTTGALKGVVLKKMFIGYSNLLYVNMGDKVIAIRSVNEPVQPGNEIYFRLPQMNEWYL